MGRTPRVRGGWALTPGVWPLGIHRLHSGRTLKSILVDTDRELWNAFTQWSPAGWLSRHTSVSVEDFAKEPHRNRLSVLLSRNSHLASHLGQIALTQPRG